MVAANIISAKFFPDVLIPKPNKLHHRAGISVGANFYQPIFVEGGWCIDNPPKIGVGSTVSVLFTVQGAGSIKSRIAHPGSSSTAPAARNARDRVLVPNRFVGPAQRLRKSVCSQAHDFVGDA